MTRSLPAFFRGAESQAGQAIVLVAITMLGMIMMVGLAIDAGQLYSSRRTMQEAADAGAYAGAVVLYQQGTQAQARAAAVNDVALNGYTHGVDGFTVVVAAPPVSGAYAGNPLYVEVQISGFVRTALVPAQSVLTYVGVRAAAGSEPLNNEYAIMSLDRGNTNCAFSTSSNADIHLTGGGILTNSSSNTAACNLQTTASRFTIDPAPPHGVDINGGSSSTWPAGMAVDTAQPQAADPFAGFPKPPTTGCDPAAPNDPCAVYNALPGGATQVLNPGIYTVQIGGAGGSRFILNPGIYILKQGLDLAGNADLYSAGLDAPPTCVVNCGVFLFSTHTNYPGTFRPGTDSCAQTNLQGNAVVSLAAMTTGTYKNFLFYQDGACSDPAWNVKIAGNGAFTGTGTIYIPTNEFLFDGNNATLTGSQLVAKTVDLQNGNITIDFVSGTSAQPILPRLAE